MATPKGKKRVKKNIATGIVHIFASFNNTIITVTDTNGAAVSWSTCGTRGFKGSRKSTPFAAQVAAEDACRKAQDHGRRHADSAQRLPSAQASPRLTRRPRREHFLSSLWGAHPDSGRVF
jgi:small subunit ribosomal protein S11